MTCECEAQAWERPLHPGGVDQYAYDFENDLARWLERRTTYQTSTFLRSRLVPGYEWEVTVAGQTGLKEPRLSTTIGQTTQDGAAVLTCRALSTSSLEAVLSDAEWEAPDGITVSGETETGQRAIATLEADESIAVGDYPILITATAGTKTIPVTCVLRVSKC